MEPSYEFDVKDWDYLAEGNQHLILRYLSNPLENCENFLSGKVLKVEKIYNQKDPDENSLKYQGLNDILNYYVRRNFYKNYPELSHYLPYEEKAMVNNKTDFLMKISEKVENLRPENRKIKSINVFSDVILSENLNILYPNTKGFIVEIKPKSPLTESIDENEFKLFFSKKFPQFKDKIAVFYEALQIKLNEMRFIKMQILRNQGKEAKLSEFNPKDLFSQEYGGIKKCLEALLVTPLNNFIIHDNTTGVELKDLIEDIANILLTNKSLFSLILNFQKCFEVLPEEIYKMAEKLDLDALEEELNNNPELILGETNEKNEIFKKTILFLISLTWKDLGLIINFVMDEGKEEIDKILMKIGFKKVEGPIKGFYRLGLIDVKLKGIQKVLEFEETQTKVNGSFMSHLINNYIKEAHLN